MWWLLACATPDSTAAFSMAGCVQHESWSSTPGDSPDSEATTLFLDADRLAAYDRTTPDEFRRGHRDWDGGCGVHSEFVAGYAPDWSPETYTWDRTCDEHDELLSETVTDTYEDQGLHFTSQTTLFVNTYAGDLLTAQEVTLLDAGGSPDRVWTRTYTYDDAGELLEWVESVQGEVQSVWTLTWDDGLLVEQRWEMASFGTTVWTYTYDDLERQTGLEERQDEDTGTAWSGERYTYDDETPRVTVTETSSDKWASVDETRMSRWTCPG